MDHGFGYSKDPDAERFFFDDLQVFDKTDNFHGSLAVWTALSVPAFFLIPRDLFEIIAVVTTICSYRPGIWVTGLASQSRIKKSCYHSRTERIAIQNENAQRVTADLFPLQKDKK